MEVKKTIRTLERLSFFDYLGKHVDKASVSIHIGDKLDKGELRVGNIVPIEKDQLSIDEYNAVLLQFYDDVIKQRRCQALKL